MSVDEKIAPIRVKIKRATKHLAELQAERDRFFATDAYETFSDVDPNTGERVFQMRNVKTIPDTVLPIIGHILRESRGALDDLARQLVIANGNSPKPDTSFPIFGNAEECIAMNTGKVEGMSQSAKDKIRAAEPYENGKGDFLWLVNKLDVANESQGLSVGVCLSGTNQPSLSPLKGIPINWGEPLKAGDAFFKLFKDHANHNVGFTFDISLSEPGIDSMPAIKTLDHIVSSTDNLITEFAPLLD